MSDKKQPSVVPPPPPPLTVSMTANDIDWTLVTEMDPSFGLQFLMSSFGSDKHKVRMYEAIYELEYLRTKLKFIEKLSDKPDIQTIFYNNLRLEGFILPT